MERAETRRGTGQDLTGLWAHGARTRALVDALQEGVILLDASTRILVANRMAERILGMPQSELHGRTSLDPAWSAIHPDGTTWPGTTHPTVVCLATGKPQTAKLMGIRSKDSVRWVRINAQPIYHDRPAQGCPDAVLCTLVDVTDPMSDRAELDAVRHRLSLAGRGAIDLARIDATGQILDLASASEELLGWDRTQLVGGDLSDLVHPEDVHRAARTWGTEEPTVLRVRHANGSYRWLEVSGHPAGQESRDGSHAQALDLVARDVTDRQLALDGLRQAEERFRLAFDMAPIGNAIVLPDGRFMRVNAQLAAMLGKDELDLLGGLLSEQVRAEDGPSLGRFLSQVMQDEGAVKCELRLAHTTGRPVHAAVTASVVHEADGQPGYIIAQMEDITARKLAQAALTHQATHDPLTALPNRTLLLDRLGHSLARARRNHTHVALLFCDVDRFKRINDSLGHEVGDLLLVEIARRLRATIRGADTAGRLSGDEFLVICDELTDADDALILADRVRSITDQPILVAGQTVAVSLSIGVAHAQHDDEPAALLRRADTAMYEAKERGRGRFEVFDEALRDRARQRLKLESELRRAVSGGELRLFHQPVVDLRDGRILGREALVRWQHPDRGLLAPGAFLDVAEESDLIVDLGGWVLGEACRQGDEMRNLSGGHMAINVSARQLGRSDFRQRVEEALEASGLPHDHLVLELTETSLLKAAADTLADVEALSREGVRLAVDDFGTGYSSLTYLQKLPVRVVKIDRSFVADIASDPKRRAIAKAVISLGQALELEIIAEGVETAEQAAMLADMGCLQAQGYLFGRPAPMHAESLDLAG